MNLSLYLPHEYFSSIVGIFPMYHKVLNYLPQSIKNLSNDTKQFKSALKNYLHAHSFYSMDEYFNVNTEWCKIRLY
jgi:hypothetical protein